MVLTHAPITTSVFRFGKINYLHISTICLNLYCTVKRLAESFFENPEIEKNFMPKRHNVQYCMCVTEQAMLDPYE